LLYKTNGTKTKREGTERTVELTEGFKQK